MRRMLFVGLAASAISSMILFSSCTTPEQENGEAPEAKIESQLVPEVQQTADEIRAEMKRYEPFSPAFDDARRRLVVVLHRTLQKEGVDGFQQSPANAESGQSARVDPNTGKIAWRAMTCFNPECKGHGKGGGPLLMVYEYSNITLGPDGNLDIGPPDFSAPPVACPVCGSSGFLRYYDPPETEFRRLELQKELRQSYKAYAAAAARSAGMPKEVRSPSTITGEINELPKLFLVPGDEAIILK